jgi:transposase
MSYIEGESRNQALLFPEILDDCISQDNVVRFLDVFVDGLRLEELGFGHSVPETTGRPPYDPRDLLKLYLYGYLNGVRSSRRLERECGRNVELMWLLKKLRPDFKTIADFRKDNRKAFKGVFRQFTLLCKAMGLLGGDLIAIDGSKLKAVNSSGRNFSEKKLQKKIKEIEEKIEKYLADLDRGDEQEAKAQEAGGEGLKEKLRS